MNKGDGKQTSGTLAQVAKAIMWAFMGIRKKSAHEYDAATLKPAQVIIGGLIGGAFFVIGILLLVKLVLSLN